MSVRKLSRFITAIIEMPDVEELVLFHLNINQRRVVVARHHEWEVPDDIASTIFEEARNVSSAYPGPQSFILGAYKKEDKEYASAIATTGFRVDPQPTIDGADASGSEPPTEVGLVAQLMRHVENKERTMNSMFGGVVSYLVKDNERKGDQIETLLKYRTDQIEVVESLHTKKHERDMEQKQIEAKVERNKELFDRILTYFPVVVNHLAGKELVRQKDSELELVAMELARTLTMPQLDRIKDSGIFQPQQLLLVGTMLEKVVKRMKTEEEMKAESKSAQTIAKS